MKIIKTTILMIIIGVMLTGCGNKSNIKKGYEAINNANYTEAIELFSKVLEKDCDDVAAAIGKANAEILSIDNEKAALTIKQISQMTKNDYEQKYTVQYDLKGLVEWLLQFNIQNGRQTENDSIIKAYESSGWQIYDRPVKPSADKTTGNYNDVIDVNMSGDNILYTLNNAEPIIGDGNTINYSTPVNIRKNGTSVLKIRSFDENYVYSDVNTYTYELNLPNFAAPISNKKSGSYTGKSISVLLTNPNAYGDIYYTTDGSEPTESSNKYSETIYIGTGNTTLKARVISPENNRSSESLSLEYSVTSNAVTSKDAAIAAVKAYFKVQDPEDYEDDYTHFTVEDCGGYYKVYASFGNTAVRSSIYLVDKDNSHNVEELGG